MYYSRGTCSGCWNYFQRMMKKFLIILFLFLIKTSILFAERTVPAPNDEKIKTEVKLTCVSTDGTLTQSVQIVSIKQSIKIKGENKRYNLLMGAVNGHHGVAKITDAFYTIDYEVGPKDNSIKINYSVDRTRATFQETWRMPNGKIEVFRGNCKSVKPKI